MDIWILTNGSTIIFLDNHKKCCQNLVSFVDFSSIQKYPDTWILMDKLSIIQVSMISNYPWYATIHDIQLFMLSNIHCIQVSMISKYPWYPNMRKKCYRDVLLLATVGRKVNQWTGYFLFQLFQIKVNIAGLSAWRRRKVSAQRFWQCEPSGTKTLQYRNISVLWLSNSSSAKSGRFITSSVTFPCQNVHGL